MKSIFRQPIRQKQFFDGMKVDVKCVQSPHGFNVIDNIFEAWKTVNSKVQMTSQLEWLLRFIAASLTILILLIMATMPNRYHRGSA